MRLHQVWRQRRRQQASISGILGEPMATYRMVYGDDDQAVTEIYDNIDTVEREDGWLVLFRGRDAILRVQESHVQSFERLVA
jgi:hypothetical protein